LLEGPSIELDAAAAAGRARLREQMRALKDRMDARRNAPGADAAERDRTEALQAEQRARVDEYLKRNGAAGQAELGIKPPLPAARGVA